MSIEDTLVGEAFRPLFFDSGNYSVDDKGRISLAVEFRFRVSPGGLGPFVVTVGNQRCLKVYAAKDWDVLLGNLTAEFLQLDPVEFEDYARWLSSLTTTVAPDAQGRIRIPGPLLKFAGIEREASVVAVINCVELWNPKELEAKQEGARERYLKPHARLTIGSLSGPARSATVPTEPAVSTGPPASPMPGA